MKQKEILFVIVSFFILIVIYVAFSVYHNSVTSNIPENLNIQVLPISPTFDEKAISDLKKRNNVTPVFQVGLSTPTPAPTIIPISTQSATASESATPSAQQL